MQRYISHSIETWLNGDVFIAVFFVTLNFCRLNFEIRLWDEYEHVVCRQFSNSEGDARYGGSRLREVFTSIHGT
jgi:hypothetical protein